MLRQFLFALFSAQIFAQTEFYIEKYAHLLTEEELKYFESEEFSHFCEELQLRSSVEPSNNTDDIEFVLWTRDNWFDDQILIFGDADSVANSNFDPSKPTKVLVHGFTDHGRVYWIRHMRDAYLGKGKIF